eukprot:1159145-Pelagomonas_calceolata.AAC.9
MFFSASLDRKSCMVSLRVQGAKNANEGMSAQGNRGHGVQVIQGGACVRRCGGSLRVSRGKKRGHVSMRTSERSAQATLKTWQSQPFND